MSGTRLLAISGILFILADTGFTSGSWKFPSTFGLQHRELAGRCYRKTSDVVTSVTGNRIKKILSSCEIKPFAAYSTIQVDSSL